MLCFFLARLFPVSGMIFLFFAGQAFAAELVAEVGGIPVTRYELQRQKQKILPMEVGFHGKLSQEKAQRIEEKARAGLIEQAYKVRYALDKELAVENAALEERFQAVRSRFPDSPSMEKALGGEGISGLRASLYRELLAQQAEREAVDRRITVSEEEVLSYYRQNAKSFIRPRQFTASHILLRIDPAASPKERDEVKIKAEGLLEKARSGEDFYNLAYFNSDDRSKFVGGSLGSFHQGQTVKEFEDALLEMKAGEIAGPVRTMYGYHIIKLDAVEESRQLGFEEVREKIREVIRARKRESIYSEWMKDLKARYLVKVVEGN